jgi:hypothetical protein
MIVDGDMVADSRGRCITTTSREKVANAVNYYLSNSPYFSGIMNSVQADPISNEFLVRTAVTNTMDDIVAKYSSMTWLPDDERIKSVSDLQIFAIDATGFAFTVSVITYAGTIFSLNLQRY